ncbi:CLUMA_CG020631, isoform B [Clunio marinus]|uniref:CLUMA_CG020631, isoform B n=1 Tax=Clunio marinus TaxID=568069 RepID=A0A1J1J6R5_9DIPT|nr:CLUMA_CG020631, isoform B [Clunio marinus]
MHVQDRNLRNLCIIYAQFMHNLCNILEKYAKFMHKLCINYACARQMIHNLIDYKNKAPFVGFFNFTTPYLLVIDPELTKQIMIKDFKHFRNNEFSTLSNKKKDPVMALNPFVMRDDEWKEKRTEVAVGMTQNKLKSIFPLIEDVARKFAIYIGQEIEKNSRKTFNARDICVRYTCDTVATCIFAIDGGSFTKDDSAIILMGDKMIRSISDAAKSFLPKRLMPQDVEDFFVYLMEEAIKYRTENGIERDDFLSHIISLKKKKNISDIEMASHGVTFFLDGYDTSSVALAPLFLELARNQKAQDKLRAELREAVGDSSQITYEELMDLPYLDQVVYESLRLTPPLTFSNRECSESIEIEGVKGHKALIEKGLRIFIPILSFHHYFHDPDDFIPERFDHGAVKMSKDKGVLLPFGLGMRFALLQLKAATFEIIRNFRVTLDPKMSTEKVLEIDPDELLMNVKKDGIWLNFEVA